jgi:hypothetical protein
MFNMTGWLLDLSDIREYLTYFTAWL